MCHYDLPCCIEDEDVEILYFSKRSTIHPLVHSHGQQRQQQPAVIPVGGESKGVDVIFDDAVPLEYQHQRCESKFVYGDGLQGVIEDGDHFTDPRRDDGKMRDVGNRNSLGGGAILGLDLDVISQSIRVSKATKRHSHASAAMEDEEEEDDDEEDAEEEEEAEEDEDQEQQYSELANSSYDIASSIRPLETRLKFFSSSQPAVDMYEINWVLTLVQQMRYLSMEPSIEGGSFDGEESDLDVDASVDDGELENSTRNDGNGAGHRLHRNTQKLDNEYRNAQLKIVDLGNACWTYRHFTEDIQTRQYRAPEVLIGAPYDTAADMWSLACILFELLTGDLMFDPHAGKSWSREEDHLALMMELLGDFPRSLLSQGKYTSDYFNRAGELKHIHNLNFWGLQGVLVEKYNFLESEAAEVANFLLPLLDIDPKKRATAQECLRHPFLVEGNLDSAALICNATVEQNAIE